MVQPIKSRAVEEALLFSIDAVQALGNFDYLHF